MKEDYKERYMGHVIVRVNGHSTRRDYTIRRRWKKRRERRYMMEGGERETWNRALEGLGGKHEE